MIRRILPAGLLCVVLTACTLGPDYERPPVTTPEQWRQAAAEEASIANVPWWELFEDEQLQSLITLALQENRDLRIAIERIEEARALYGISRSQLYPQVDARGVGGAIRFSDGSLSHLPTGGGDNTSDIYVLDVGVTWEIDFFGRVRRANQAQLANLVATREARRAVAMSLVAEVARAYVELRDLDRRLEISRRTLESRREYETYARDRFEGGVTHELDWRQAEAELHRVQSFVYDIEKLVTQKENEIAYLLGHNPQATPRGRAVEEIPVLPQVPAGLPASLLERRPDVREAEERLVSATALIGEAKARLYPSIGLTGSYGLASRDLGDLVDGDSLSWNFLAGIVQPIFNAGKNRRRVEVRESQQRQAVYEYEKTLLKAFREVEDSLVALQKTGEQRAAQAQRVEAERKVVELSELRYRGGVADYLEVLDAQRSLFDAEIDEVASVSGQVTALIQLYKALGGGWPTEREPEEGVTAEGGPSAEGSVPPAPVPAAPATPDR